MEGEERRETRREAGKQTRRRKRQITVSSGTEDRKGGDGGMIETGVDGNKWVERGRKGMSKEERKAHERRQKYKMER